MQRSFIQSRWFPAIAFPVLQPVDAPPYYSKTRDVYMAYRNAGYSKKFYEEHTADLLLHKAAKKAFDELGVKKTPTVKSLNTEYAELQSAKKKAFIEYTNARAEMREVMVVKANVERILKCDENLDVVPRKAGVKNTPLTFWTPSAPRVYLIRLMHPIRPFSPVIFEKNL